jgi:flagellar motor switch protein FliG
MTDDWPMENTRTRSPRRFNGLALLVAILREAPPSIRSVWIAKVAKVSPTFARIAEEFEFVFTDLSRLTDKSLQKVLTRVIEKNWLIAWKLTPFDLRQRLLANMSPRKREDFLASATSLPRMPRRQVVAVQVQIAKQIRDMLRRGELEMTSKRPTVKDTLRAGVTGKLGADLEKNPDASKRNKS